MFGIILLSAITVMQVYVFLRAATIPFIKRNFPVKYIIITGVILWIPVFISRGFRNYEISLINDILDLFSMTWMAVLFLTFIPVLIIDLITGFGFLLTRYAGRARGYALIIGLLLSAIALMQGLRPPVVKNYTITLPNIPDKLDGLSIVAIADTHLGSSIGPEWLEARVKQISGLNPDLILLLGDISEGHGYSHEEFLPIINKLAAPLGVWGVLGNHEFHSYRNMDKSLIEKSNINLLRNSWRIIRPGLVLAGVDDLTSALRSGRSNDLISQALKDRPKGITILLSHSPLDIEKAANLNVDLMLCGHTHGGQIWPFSYLVKLRYPYLVGRYRIKKMNLVVTRGAGTWGPRMRLWAPGEILHITLHKKY